MDPLFFWGKGASDKYDPQAQTKWKIQRFTGGLRIATSQWGDYSIHIKKSAFFPVSEEMRSRIYLSQFFFPQLIQLFPIKVSQLL